VAGAPVDLIQRVPLFADLGRRDVEQIANSMKERNFAEGETLTVEGRGGVGFFVIEDGQARVSVHDEERAKLGPGDYFGEMALIDEGARTATVVAETDLRCYTLTPWEFRPFVEEHPDVAWTLLRTLMQRLRATDAR
jgi:CRP/FNR family transcriptional regulator, cyclic AMP receptor protein